MQRLPRGEVGRGTPCRGPANGAGREGKGPVLLLVPAVPAAPAQLLALPPAHAAPALPCGTDGFNAFLFLLLSFFFFFSFPPPPFFFFFSIINSCFASGKTLFSLWQSPQRLLGDALFSSRLLSILRVRPVVSPSPPRAPTLPPPSSPLSPGGKIGSHCRQKRLRADLMDLRAIQKLEPGGRRRGPSLPWEPLESSWLFVRLGGGLRAQKPLGPDVTSLLRLAEVFPGRDAEEQLFFMAVRQCVKMGERTQAGIFHQQLVAIRSPSLPNRRSLVGAAPISITTPSIILIPGSSWAHPSPSSPLI